MKKLYTFLIALIFSISAFAQIPTNGLIAWYPFSSNANDASGNGNNGTVNGATLTTDRFGIANNAYSFDGINDYIYVTNFIAPQIGTGDFSISAWVKPLVIAGDARMIIVDQSSLNSFQVNIDPNAQIELWMGYNGYGTSNLSWNLGQWYHLIVVRNNGIATIYSDNSIIWSTNDNGSINQFTDISIGYRPFIHPPYFHPFDGSLDDIRLYNRALTQTEITALYNETPCSTPMPIVSDVTLCGGGITTLTATGGSQYIWYDAPTGGTQIASGATYTTPFLTTSTTYYVANWDGICESVRDTVVVTIYLLPTVSINAVPDFININASPVSLSGTPSGGSFTGDGVSNNQFDPVVAGLGLTYVHYSYTDTTNNCSNTASESIIVYDTTGIICTDTVHISVTDTLIINAVLTGINPPNNINTLKIYPNPANTHIYIYCGNYSLMNGYTIRIDNSLAQTVFTTPVAQQQYYVDLSVWSGTGTYFVYIIDDLSNIIDVRKIILQ